MNYLTALITIPSAILYYVIVGGVSVSQYILHAITGAVLS
jgi:hypothetical protein